jgi:hypothetical protein
MNNSRHTPPPEDVDAQPLACESPYGVRALVGTVWQARGQNSVVLVVLPRKMAGHP